MISQTIHVTRIHQLRTKERILMKNKQHSDGFTIVELLVVISIIALLVGILVPAVQKARDSAKVTQSKSNIHQVAAALANYEADFGRHFSTAPNHLSGGGLEENGGRQGMAIEDAVTELGGDGSVADLNVMGIELGEHEVNGMAYVYYIGLFGNGGDESAGIAPYAFSTGLTTSTTGKAGYGVWRYPNAGQVAVYMNGLPLHSAYFAPKDTIPLRALEPCEASHGTYCPTSAMAAGHSQLTEGIWRSNMLGAPSSYCISPAMMYSPSVYQYNIMAGQKPTDPMDLPRGFTPPSGSQVKYPGQKTWLMEHNWLQNLDNNDCGVNWEFGGWFNDADGCWEGCEPEHFNASRHSEPVMVFADNSVQTYSISQFAEDSALVKQDMPAWHQEEGTWFRNIGSFGFDENMESYYVNLGTDWVNWGGHTHTMFGAKGRDKLNK